MPSLGKRPNLKVHINTTSDSILLKFLRPNPNVKLEGFLLGYGSNLSPNQYFPLPAEGKHTEAVVGKMCGFQAREEDGSQVMGTTRDRNLEGRHPFFHSQPNQMPKLQVIFIIVVMDTAQFFT